METATVNSAGFQAQYAPPAQMQPQYQYAAVQAPAMQPQMMAQMQPPPQAPAPNYPQYLNAVPVTTVAAVPTTAAVVPAVPVATTTPTLSTTSQALAAGVFGLIVVASGTMGANLHKVSDGEMSMGDALGNSLVKGAVGGVAAASAVAASSALTSGGLTGLAVTLATATGVSYLLSR